MNEVVNACVCLLNIGLDPALVSLSLAYVISLSDIFAFLLRTSTEVENLVSIWLK